MQATLVDFTKDRVVYNITGCTRAELENKLNLFFSAQGYRQKSSTDTSFTYEKGNRVLRLLLGAFVKYHKQIVGVQQQGDVFSLFVQRDSSGMSGGVIGMNQVRKEFARLAEEFRTYFTA